MFLQGYAFINFYDTNTAENFGPLLSTVSWTKKKLVVTPARCQGVISNLKQMVRATAASVGMVSQCRTVPFAIVLNLAPGDETAIYLLSAVRIVVQVRDRLLLVSGDKMT